MRVIQFYYQDNSSLDFINDLVVNLPDVVINSADKVIDSENYLLLTAEDELIANINGFTPFNLFEFYRDFINKRHAILNKELLLGAINYSKLQNFDNLTVLDMTGGLGRDTILFALAGLNVTVVEQNPFLVIALRYLKLKFVDLINDVTVINANSTDILANADSFDFIYYDPMFEDGKHALAKKDMQIIDKLIELYSQPITTEVTNSQILQQALSKSHKFVVKRDNKQPLLVANIKPTYQKKGKTIRFDIYQGKNKLPSE